MRGRRTLLIALLLGLVGVATVPRMLSPRGPGPTAGARTTGELYAAPFQSTRHERMFLASVAFVVALR